MKRLWAAWRMKYITNAEQETGCIFCNALTKADDDQNLVIRREQHAFIMLNKYPYTSGHLMVAPFAHQASLELLEPGERAEMMELVSQCITALRQIYHPHGFNVGINIGAAAGAGVPGHVHIHIVPRWNGDTNFMSTIGEVRVLPESLEETYRRVKEILHDR
ncbi:MAG: HIT domain-containing protein [Anaerolineales bacterium]